MLARRRSANAERPEATVHDPEAGWNGTDGTNGKFHLFHHGDEHILPVAAAQPPATGDPCSEQGGIHSLYPFSISYTP
jgi:hypothetical protein